MPNEEEFWEEGGGVSSWTEPHAPLPRRRPIVHGFVGLPIVVPTGDDILILLDAVQLLCCHPKQTLIVAAVK
jgi:hypothetical protein